MLDGHERREQFDYPDEEWNYYLFAKEFGWPPSVADEQPAYLVDWLLAIHAEVKEVEALRANG